jgi:hypothetical protein
MARPAPIKPNPDQYFDIIRPWGRNRDLALALSEFLPGFTLVVAGESPTSGFYVYLVDIDNKTLSVDGYGIEQNGLAPADGEHAHDATRGEVQRLTQDPWNSEIKLDEEIQGIASWVIETYVEVKPEEVDLLG